MTKKKHSGILFSVLNLILIILMHCFVNVVFNAEGFYVLRYASAIINSVMRAVILPTKIHGFHKNHCLESIRNN